MISRQLSAHAGNTPVKVIHWGNGQREPQREGHRLLSLKNRWSCFRKDLYGFWCGRSDGGRHRAYAEVVGPEMGVKASGGVRTRDDADKMIAAGANRLGAKCLGVDRLGARCYQIENCPSQCT